MEISRFSPNSPEWAGCLARFCLCNGVLEPSQERLAMNESHHLAKSEAIAAASDHMRSQVLPLLETAHESSTVLMVLMIDAACRIGRVSIFAQTAHPSRQRLGG